MNPIQIARTLFEDGWNRQDFTAVRPLLADEFPLHIGSDTRITNAAELEGIVAAWHTAFSDFRFDIHSITTDDHLAAVRATLHGTHQGPWAGLQATGRRVAVDHAFFLSIEDGIIVEVWEIEPPRVVRRLLTLRGWSHDRATEAGEIPGGAA